MVDPSSATNPLTEALAAASIVPHDQANITGHGWRKVMRHAKALTYRFHAPPPVPEVLQCLQQETGSDARAMSSTAIRR